MLPGNEIRYHIIEMSKPLRDVVGPDLKVLFCGINPSILSYERGHHFARPGNRFWPALHGSGWTPRLMKPDEDTELPKLGIGITNVVDRPTRAAAELSDDELRDGAAALSKLAAQIQPGVVAIVGLGAYRVGFGKPDAGVGPQDEAIGGRPAWVLPNPSGLNAHYQLPDLIREFAALRSAHA
jgi:TDG/mug DNA glycosylase family protein